jgi:hypothetical protein
LCERRFYFAVVPIADGIICWFVCSTRGAFDQQLTDLHEIVGEHRGAHKQFEALGALGEATLPAPKRWPSLATATLSSPMPADINILVYNWIIASRTNREVVCV